MSIIREKEHFLAQKRGDLEWSMRFLEADFHDLCVGKLVWEAQFLKHCKEAKDALHAYEKQLDELIKEIN